MFESMKDMKVRLLPCGRGFCQNHSDGIGVPSESGVTGFSEQANTWRITKNKAGIQTDTDFTREMCRIEKLPVGVLLSLVPSRGTDENLKGFRSARKEKNFLRLWARAALRDFPFPAGAG
jgi:hypothetical protein